MGYFKNFIIFSYQTPIICSSSCFILRSATSELLGLESVTLTFHRMAAVLDTSKRGGWCPEVGGGSELPEIGNNMSRPHGSVVTLEGITSASIDANFRLRFMSSLVGETDFLCPDIFIPVGPNMTGSASLVI